MATVAHHIYSTYDPGDRETLEEETGQNATDATDPWLTEHAFGARKRLTNHPRFVAASVDCDHKHDVPRESWKHTHSSATEEDGDVGGWYRSLVRRREGQGSSVLFRTRSLSPPKQSQLEPSTSNRPLRRDKNNWFISRVLEEDSATRSSSASPPPRETLADILSRDPPPTPFQQPFVPPVWLAIGPGNKGFAMLHQSGWREGEALGRTAPRRARSGIGFAAEVDYDFEAVTGLESSRKRLKIGEEGVKKEVKEIRVALDDEVEEVRKVDVIDLTTSDYENEDEQAATDVNVAASSNSPEPSPPPDTSSSHNPVALLTPLPTILKSDRLGIGLKAKRAGPFRESVKRVTHSQAALSAHVRASEQARKQKSLFGRGARGFERMKRRDESERRNMLAYLNAD